MTTYTRVQFPFRCGERDCDFATQDKSVMRAHLAIHRDPEEIVPEALPDA